MTTKFPPSVFPQSPWGLRMALFALAFVVPTFAHAAIPESERAALIALYDSTQGATWVNKTGWLGASGTECDWYGVSCDAQRGHVIGMNLSENHLSGKIPPEIGDFPYLSYLALNRNTLSGEVPAEIGRLSSLAYLYAYDNALTGNLPPELGQLSHLWTLNLAYNDLTGAIPPQIGNLMSLRDLELPGNQLSGPIPRELAQLANLDNLLLGDNRLTGNIPKALAGMSNIESIDLSNNSLVGKIPEELANLTHLIYLVLSHNQLTGKVPEGLDASGILDLSYNRLSGKIPVSLGNVAASTVDLQANRLSGPIPSFHHASNLQFLSLSQNRLTGALPADLGDLPSLDALELAGNGLTGEIPASFSHLVRLGDDYLDLRWNALWSHDPALIAFLNSKQRDGVDFQATQTVPPEGLRVGSPTGSSLMVSWSPILYQADAGGYQVFKARRPQGPFTLAGTVPSKALGSYQVTGLQRGTTYYFLVRSSTLAHPPYNQSDVMSPPSAVVSGTTLPWVIGA